MAGFTNRIKRKSTTLIVPTYSHCHLLGLIFHFPRLAFIALSQQSYYYRGYIGIVTFTKKLFSLSLLSSSFEGRLVESSRNRRIKVSAQNAALNDISPLLVATLGMSWVPSCDRLVNVCLRQTVYQNVLQKQFANFVITTNVASSIKACKNTLLKKNHETKGRKFVRHFENFYCFV